ncbi:pathogenesis-related protein PR-1 type-like [Bidens hawaiensis]|uniref:pathogenesis-related protein PR-1 type-like n=1 Tax=Bidens hawaiensis TaxID=980011 RepID=UPI00404A7F8E
MSGHLFAVFILILHFIYTKNAPQDFVNAHNAVRKEVGLGPMSWNATVAQFAESYANKRKVDWALVHSNSEQYGENIAIGYEEFSGLDAIKLWVDEKADYNYGLNSCPPFKMCLHYTQVVWKTSIHIGCARVKCVNNIL